VVKVSPKKEAPEELGSLAQSARKTSLGSARGIMIFIGILSILVNIALIFLAEKMVIDAVQKEVGQQNMGLPEVQEHIKKATLVAQVVQGGFAFVGLIFLVLAALIYKAPVVCTTMGLVLYLVGWAVPVALSAIGGDMEEAGRALASGILIKIIIILALVRAIQSAVAYQNEQKTAVATKEEDSDPDLIAEVN